MTDDNKNRNLPGKALQIVLTALLCLAVLAAASWAWLSHDRAVAGIALIDSPRNIYITAAHREDLIYLDLTDIDLEKNYSELNPNEQGSKRYKDYLFTVTGEGIEQFKLQLAYTTNNQFSFEIFEATEDLAKKDNSTYSLDYLSMDGTTTHTYYFPASAYLKSYDNERASGKALEMTYFNRTAEGALELGNSGAPISKSTYTSDTSEYTNVNKFAYPIYCQTTSSIEADKSHSDLSGETRITFYNYFILRVIWPANRINDGETDILYISAAQA